MTKGEGTIQIERLIQMVFYIVNHGHVTAKELSDFFNISMRTIYRDINTLTLAGVPVISAKGSDGKIQLCGPFKGYPGVAGMVIFKTQTYEETGNCADWSLLWTRGATYALASLQVADKDNNYLL